MRTEVPEFRRCCFCLPLRRSLIAWGYFKLVVACILLLYCIAGVCQIIYTLMYIRPRMIIQEMIVLIVILALVIVDVVLHILFLIGAHRKETKFLRVYYYYSITLLVLSMLLDIYCGGMIIYSGIYRYIDVLALSAFAVMFLNLVTQVYVILLVRSEIIKLNNIGSFQFVNNAAEAEAECKLHLQVENLHEHKEKSNTDLEEINGNDV